MAKKTYIATYTHNGMYSSEIDFTTTVNPNGMSDFQGSTLSAFIYYIPSTSNVIPACNYVVPLLSIFNSESDKLVSIKDIQLNNVGVNSVHSDVNFQTRPMSYASLNLIASDITNGVTVTPIKADSNNPDLPTQVTSYRHGISPSGTKIRNMTLCQNRGVITFGYVAGAAHPRMHPFGTVSRGTLKNTSSYGFGIGDISSTSPSTELVLREGEGISIDMANAVLSCCAEVQITFAAIGGGDTPPYDTYYINEYVTLYGDETTSIVSLFNGVGSGVIIEIKNIIFGIQSDVYYTAAGVFPAKIPVTLVDEIIERGTDIAPISMDSSNDAVPSGIVIQTGGRLSKYGTKQNGYYLQPFLGAGCIEQPLGSGTKAFPVDFPGQCESLRKFGDYDTQKFNLRYGQGIAVYCTTPTEIGRPEVTIIFTVEDIPASGGITEYSYGSVA